METLWESTQSILLCKKPFQPTHIPPLTSITAAIDVRGILVAQENDRAGNVFRYAKAAGRIGFEEERFVLFALICPEAADSVTAHHGAGSDCIDRHTDRPHILEH